MAPVSSPGRKIFRYVTGENFFPSERLRVRREDTVNSNRVKQLFACTMNERKKISSDYMEIAIRKLSVCILNKRSADQLEILNLGPRCLSSHRIEQKQRRCAIAVPMKSLLTFFAIARHRAWPRQRVFLAAVSSLITSLASHYFPMFRAHTFSRKPDTQSPAD